MAHTPGPHVTLPACRRHWPGDLNPAHGWGKVSWAWSPTTLIPSAGVRGGIAGPSFPDSRPHNLCPLNQVKKEDYSTLTVPGDLLLPQESRVLFGDRGCVKMCAQPRVTGQGEGHTVHSTPERGVRPAVGRDLQGRASGPLLPLVWAIATAPHRPHCSRDDAKRGGICWSEPGGGPGPKKRFGRLRVKL